MRNYLIHGGSIVLMAPQAAAAEAVVTKGQRIAFVGELAAAKRFARVENLAAEEVDLAGRALLPGFIDGHMHPLPMIFFSLSADLDGAHTLEEVRRRLERQVERLGPDDWLLAVQFENNRLSAGVILDADVLSRWFPDRYVSILARDGHSVLVNNRVLDLIDLNQPDPDGGSIGRHPAGRPTGYFYEKAAAIAQAVTRGPSSPRFFSEGRSVFDRLARAGITSVGLLLQSDEEGPGGAGSRRESAIMASLRDQIPQSVYAIIIGKTLEGLKAAMRSSLNDPETSRVNAFKIFADGTFGSCTACMAEAYADQPCTHGYMTLPEDQIYGRMEAAHVAGFQICIHAVGDQGIANCVRMFERLLCEHPRPHRHRIEHASIADPALIARIAALGLHICTQPLFIRSERDWLPTRLGSGRAAHAYPFRDFLDAGVIVAGSSDAPIEDISVIDAIDFAVNRGGFHPEQGVSVAEALAMYTTSAARLEFSEADKGSIEAGKLADFVILDRDPLACPPADIGTLAVHATMIRGDLVYDTFIDGKA